MAILGVVLKIIASFLVLLMGLLLAILLLLLLGPITYKGYTAYYESAEGEWEITLFHLFRVRFQMLEGKVKGEVKLLGVNVRAFSPDELETLTKDVEADLKGDMLVVEPSKTKTKKKIAKKEKVSPFKAKWGRLKAITTDPALKPFIKHSIETLGKIIKVLKPKVFHFHLLLGKEDVAKTGELLAGLTLLFPWYYPYGTIEGNFEAAGIGGEIYLQGSFRLVQFFKIGLWWLLHKDTRQMLSRILYNREEE
ncbi:hypothetical protein CS063_07035 [Sporanaerobium hydrogeniformans]|uniref:Uncharacterized protein n=1 Tax=Sporanaerobium hydrogeniformans TaxID=3072179 RepID=A0AC61DCU6_9FIRM|nr:hypothetical protein [Sporanaerobium hydrogeniformans]PHV71079.1 hypothetical protein CS063_07035 [Sporanaerobium hydrogeniformans]